MLNKLKQNKLLVSAFCIACAFFYYLGKGNKETKIERVEVEKIVYKEKENKDIYVETIETKKPDGEIVIKTVYVDKTKTEKENTSEKVSHEIKTPQKKWSAFIGVGLNTEMDKVYSAELNRRVFSSPFFVGIRGTSSAQESSVGLNLGVEF